MHLTMKAIIDFPRDRQDRLSGLFEKPRAVLEARQINEVLPLLRAVQAEAAKGNWAIGMVAYEAARAFDAAFPAPRHVTDMPLAAFAIFEHPPVALPALDPEKFSCSPWRHDTSRQQFGEVIAALHEHIASGDYYQTNFTTRLRAELNGDAESLFAALRLAQPDSYAFFLDWGTRQIASVSPELFFAWDAKSGELTTRPMKGTAAKNSTADDLRNSIKDRAENLMIVDLLRNDIARIATHVDVPELFAVQRLPTALQMTSTIRGTTRADVGLPEIFAALFPCGSVTGAPKIAAMQAINRYESSARGIYCGAMGIVQPGGDALFSVGIRTVSIAGNHATCGIGSGITWDSDAAAEYAEGQIKTRFLWRASAGFDLLETLRLENGQYWLLERHIARSRHSADYFGFSFDARLVRKTLDDISQKNPQGLFRVRLLVNRNGHVQAEVFPLEFNAAIINIRLAAHAVDSNDEFLRHKTTNRAIYDAFTPTQADIFDTLLYNERGEITEFTRGNVAVEINGRLVTPPDDCGLLAGTLRAEYLANGTMTERTITRDDLRFATKIWFYNSLRGMISTTLLS